MNYIIQHIEQKTTSTGKVKADAVLKLPDGSLSKTVTIWADFPNFPSLAAGLPIEGDIVEKSQYATLYPPKAPKTAYTPRSATNIAKAQEVKGQQIEDAQTRKHDSIKVAGAMRDATLITLADLKDRPFPQDEDFKKAWKGWVDFLLQQHDILLDRPF